MPEQPFSSVALLVSRDLFFTSKVTGTAAELGIDIRVVGEGAVAAELASAPECRCVFIDLADEGLDVAEFFAQLGRDPHPPVVAFGSHVATARLQAARHAGCDEVFPRSRFSSSLPELLRKYCL
jgi:AmiR/NasT family two-component response regulator